jgi:hypothetical protein
MMSGDHKYVRTIDALSDGRRLFCFWWKHIFLIFVGFLLLKCCSWVDILQSEQRKTTGKRIIDDSLYLKGGQGYEENR